jgi:hypothetical protein
MNELKIVKDFIDFIEHPPKENKLRILEKKLITIYMICFDLKNTQGKDPKIKIDL